MREKLIFIDGDKESHIEWALKQSDGKSKIILLRGSVLDLMKQYKIRFYFDQNGAIIKKLNIQKIPAIVEQKEKLLLITHSNLQIREVCYCFGHR